jgi:plasmid maintenance system antidote protein VapI
MLPERTHRLITEVKAWIEVHGIKQKDLAAQLRMTPQQFNNCLRGYRELSGEQALHLQEIIGSKPKSKKRDNLTRRGSLSAVSG